MTNLSSEFTHIRPDPEKRGSWLYGIVAFYVGIAGMMGVYFLALSPLLLLMAISASFAALFGFNLERFVQVYTVVMAPVSLVFLVWISARFIFPCGFRILKRVGFFFQRAAWVTPADTWGDVRHYAGILKSDMSGLIKGARRKDKETLARIRKLLAWTGLVIGVNLALISAVVYFLAANPYTDPPPPPGLTQQIFERATWFAILSAILMVLSVFSLRSREKRAGIQNE